MTLASAADAASDFERYRKPTRCEALLAEMQMLVLWPRVVALIEPHYPKPGNGRPPVGLDRMLRIHLLQHWSNLADAACEEPLYGAQGRYAGPIQACRSGGTAAGHAGNRRAAMISVHTMVGSPPDSGRGRAAQPELMPPLSCAGKQQPARAGPGSIEDTIAFRVQTSGIGKCLKLLQRDGRHCDPQRLLRGSQIRLSSTRFGSVPVHAWHRWSAAMRLTPDLDG
jgi:IS5 family transposase